MAARAQTEDSQFPPVLHDLILSPKGTGQFGPVSSSHACRLDSSGQSASSHACRLGSSGQSASLMPVFFWFRCSISINSNYLTMNHIISPFLWIKGVMATMTIIVHTYEVPTYAPSPSCWCLVCATSSLVALIFLVLAHFPCLLPL